MADLPYRQGVGVMLFDRRGHVFVAQRIDMRSAAWQMPQGGIDPGETPREAALRELEEEIGTAKAVILGESRDWHRYDLPAELRAKLWGGRYRGQAQKWFALRFTGRDRDINLATKHPEFHTWKWVPIDDVPPLAIEFKRDIYRQLVEEFRPFAGPG